MAMPLLSGLMSLCALGAAGEEAVEGTDYVTLEASRLRCVVGNNKALGEHKNRYNGIFSMWSPDQPETPFVPFYAGINLEHYFDARPRHADGNILFEPRAVPMTLTRPNDNAVELHQAPTPYWGVESWTRFEVKDPYYLDFDFRCVPRKGDLEGGFFGVFWASYMNGPLNKSIYFLAPGTSLDKPHWFQFCTQHHDHYSTVLQENEDLDVTYRDGDAVLWNQISPLKYSAPFYYGRIRNMVLIYIFKPGPHVRFTHSPSGGGGSKSGDDNNPAWDFQLIVPDYQVDQEYGLTVRAVYKPWVDRADVIEEVKKYLEE
jgi:hypothetical protein